MDMYSSIHSHGVPGSPIVIQEAVSQNHKWNTSILCELNDNKTSMFLTVDYYKAIYDIDESHQGFSGPDHVYVP